MPHQNQTAMKTGGVKDDMVKETAEQCNALFPVLKGLLTELEPYDKTSIKYLLTCAFEAGSKFQVAEAIGNTTVKDFEEWYAALPEIKDSEIYQKIKLHEAAIIVSNHQKEEEKKHQAALTELHFELTNYFKNNLLDGRIRLDEFELRNSYGNREYEITPIEPCIEEEYKGGNNKDIEKICKKIGIKASFVSWMYRK